MLEIEELTVAYGAVRALDGVGLKVERGGITAVLGANGAGKTTLLRTISGLQPARAGRITWDGTELTGLAPDRIARGGVAHVPEGGGVITELTVEENLRLGALWRRDRADRAAAQARSTSCSRRWKNVRPNPPSTLSGGERQMLAIGRALMGRPGLLLLDEPSLGLAPLITARIMADPAGPAELDRADRGARRAERAQRAVHRGPRLRPRARPGGGRRHGGGAAGRRRPPPRLPRFLTPFSDQEVNGPVCRNSST